MASKARDLSNFISVATIDASEIASGAITTDKIADVAVTHAKLHTDMNLSGKSLTFAADQISGNAIDGGVISNFTSTGIDDNATSTAVTILSNGNVGVGTASPVSAKSEKTLQVLGNIKVGSVDGRGLLSLGDTASGNVNVGIWRGAPGAYAGTGNSLNLGGYDAIAFTVGNSEIATQTERMRIDGNGRLYLNQTAQFGNTLQRMGLKFDGNTEYGIHIATTSNTGSAINFANAAGTQIGRISVSASATGYITSSDYRLKTDVQPMSGASDRVLALKPVNFAWIVSGDRVDCFLAHETQEVVPEAIDGTKDAMCDEEYEVTAAIAATYDEDGNELTAAVEAVMGTRSVPYYQGIDQSKLVPLLTAALQEALTEITALKARVTALEGA